MLRNALRAQAAGTISEPAVSPINTYKHEHCIHSCLLLRPMAIYAIMVVLDPVLLWQVDVFRLYH